MLILASEKWLSHRQAPKEGFLVEFCKTHFFTILNKNLRHRQSRVSLEEALNSAAVLSTSALVNNSSVFGLSLSLLLVFHISFSYDYFSQIFPHAHKISSHEI